MPENTIVDLDLHGFALSSNKDRGKESFTIFFKNSCLCDSESHFRYLRMSKQTFDSLVDKVWIWIATNKYTQLLVKKSGVGVSHSHPKVLRKYSQSPYITCWEVSLDTSFFGHWKFPGIYYQI